MRGQVGEQLLEVGLSPTSNLRQAHSSFCCSVQARLAVYELLGSSSMPPISLQEYWDYRCEPTRLAFVDSREQS